MDIPTLTSPPSIHLPDMSPSYDRRHPNSRSNPHTFARSFSTHAPMPIPRSQTVEAPPALPPPRHPPGLANGNDLGWEWANAGNAGKFGKVAIKQTSSLYGGYRNPRLDSIAPPDDESDEMDLDDNSDRRGSTVSTVRSPSQAEIRVDSLGYLEENGPKPSSPSPSTVTNQRLQGETSLAQDSLNCLSYAYDKHLLLKIGKSNSPPRQPSIGSSDRPLAMANQLHRHSQDGQTLQRLSVASVPGTPLDPESQWVTYPHSAGVSSGVTSSWRDYNMGIRSPSNESSAPTSAAESEGYSRLRDGNRPSASASLPGIGDSFSVSTRSNRGSYDQAMFTEAETDFPMEETGGLRKLNLDESCAPAHVEGRLSLSKQGMKRRALSPPSEASSDDKPSSHSATNSIDVYQRLSGGFSFPRSPKYRYAPNHGSVSSVSSGGLRNNSYASSANLSAAGSSITSASSSVERPSPGGISPKCSTKCDLGQSRDLQHDISASSNPSPSTPLISTRTSSLHSPPESKSPITALKMSLQSAVHDDRRHNATRIGNLHICECCPKKPKKFDSEEELRIHAMEKQYTCQFCHNRFKNKNEAERHQNSLHLRRHSWSCAAIAGFNAAFHPSTSPVCQTPNGVTSDACGYCGEEFPNFPQPNWEGRMEHLTNAHKFGECNQAKKFFRADHFRQHLKHSHAGTSGKWTNMLENACMKDEPPLDASGSVMGVGEPTRGPSSLPSGGAVMGGKTIDEAQDES